MARNTKPLPVIPVKHAAVRKVLNITPPLEAKLRAYIAYYTEQQGLDPRQAPTETDTIVALIESYLARDSGFNRYLREKGSSSVAATGSESAAKALPKAPTKAAPV